ncbi:MAG: DUF3710 domain-containing protein [Allobranchiibius sp.]
MKGSQSVGIFRRKANGDGSTVSDNSVGQEEASDSAQDIDLHDGDADEGDIPEAGGDGTEVEDAALEETEEFPDRLPRPHALDRTSGPFDRSEVSELGERFDFGAMALQPMADMELRLDVDQDTQNITGITAVLGDSACQVQAFAAPKSHGLWDDIRDEIADGLIGGGGSATEQLGPLGIELLVRIPARGSDGRTTYSAARFAGVDGPRWFLRAVYSGAAAVDEEAAAPLLEFVRNTVVHRGTEARAPREMLALKVPESVMEAAEQGQREQNELNPFERGPEMTEVR